MLASSRHLAARHVWKQAGTDCAASRQVGYEATRRARGPTTSCRASIEAEWPHGRSYTPDNTPVYDPTDDDFLLDRPDAERVTITRCGQADVHNHLRLEWRNRANQYSLEIAEAKDRADIIRAHWICDAAVAQRVVQLLLRRIEEKLDRKVDKG